MLPTASSTKILIRLFERKDGTRTSEILFSMARKGIMDPMSSLFDHPLEDDWRDFAGAAVHERIEKRKGIVYVVANPVNNGLYKVGLTGGILEKRIRSLKTAGVVGEFIEVDHAHALDRFAAEKMAHRALGAVSQSHKEFFVTDWKTACQAVQDSVASDNALLRLAFRAIVN
jgi:hypothetical protein